MKKIVLLFLLIQCGLSVHAANRPYDLIVAKDGSGQYASVQEAVNAVPDYRKAGPTRIYIKKGTYKEKIVISASKECVQLIGEDGVILTYDDYASKTNIFGENKGTSGSASIYIFGPDFMAENITFENSSGPVGQAVELLGNMILPGSMLIIGATLGRLPQMPFPWFPGYSLYLRREHPGILRGLLYRRNSRLYLWQGYMRLQPL